MKFKKTLAIAAATGMLLSLSACQLDYDKGYETGYRNGYEDGYKDGEEEMENNICNRPTDYNLYSEDANIEAYWDGYEQCLDDHGIIE